MSQAELIAEARKRLIYCSAYRLKLLPERCEERRRQAKAYKGNIEKRKGAAVFNQWKVERIDSLSKCLECEVGKA